MIQKKLPKKWKIEKLGEVCEIKSGKNQKKVINPNGKYPIYGSSGIFGYADEYICEENTTIIGRKGTINSPIYVTTKFWNVDTAFGLCVKETLHSKFLYYFCLGFNFKKLDKSTTIPSLSTGDLLSIELLVPPLETQQAIVSKIEELFSELDKGIEHLKTAQQQLKTYRQSVLKWAFEGKLTNENVKEGELPKGWKILKIGEFGKVKGGKRLPKGHLYSENPTDFSYLRVTDFRNQTIDISKLKYLYPETQLAIKNYIISKNDVFISIAGTIGEVGTIPDELDGANLTENAAKITDLNNVSNKYLSQYLSSTEAQTQIKSKTKTTTQPKLSLYRIEDIDVPIPPIEEQHRIVQEIESRLSVADKIEESIAQSLLQAEALRQSILKKAFSGELV